MHVYQTSMQMKLHIKFKKCHVCIVAFDGVTGWELNPLISLLQTIREEYSFTKPDVYRTIVAILHDYKPISGEKHREKVMYLSLYFSVQSLMNAIRLTLDM